MSAVVDWLNDNLSRVDHPTFRNVTRVKSAELKPMGDGQIVIISDINRITLTLETDDLQEKTVKGIAKLETSITQGREFAASCNAFKTEILMYDSVLKTMGKLLNNVGDSKYVWAECYYCGEDKLLFQDLCEFGYRVVPTYKFLDLEHSLLVMRGIGKFHGLSLAMKQQGKLDVDQFGAPYFSRRLPMVTEMYRQSLSTLVKGIKEKWEPQWTPIAERVEKYLMHPGEVLYRAWKSSKGKWEVLNHGDFTMRNMLFHYPQESDKPDAIKFVDFQMCHYGSLASDLVMILYSSLRPKMREDNMDLLLQAYVQSLTLSARRQGYDGQLPTVDDVRAALKKMEPMAVITVLMTIPFFVISGKQDLQKQTDEYFEKYGTEEMAALNHNYENEMLNLYEDPEIKGNIQYELNRCVNENII